MKQFSFYQNSFTEPYEYIPIPESSEIASTINLNAIGEVPFADIGLGGYGPVGMVQNILEFLHVSCNLPWMVTISVCKLYYLMLVILQFLV